MTTGYQQTADTVQALIDDLEARIPTAGCIRTALEAQLRQQRIALAYIKRQGGIK